MLNYNKHDDILNDIFDIYTRSSDSNELRKIIENHFIPTLEQKKQCAEHPTPMECVDDMIDKIPMNFWTSPKRIFEPCCGKGNFVLRIFEKLFDYLFLIIYL